MITTDNKEFVSAYNALQELNADTKLNIASLLLGVFSATPDSDQNGQVKIELMELIEAFL